MIITMKKADGVENLNNVKRIEPILSDNKAIVSFSNEKLDIEINMGNVVVVRE